MRASHGTHSHTYTHTRTHMHLIRSLTHSLAASLIVPCTPGAQVAKHNTPNDAWISVDGKVYDVTKWEESHPGGKNILLISAGRQSQLV